MRRIATSLTSIVALLSVLASRPSSPFEDDKSVSVPAESKVYLGFDRNEYPGDAVLPVLRKTFSFSGYWLTAPPRETHNTWRKEKSVGCARIRIRAVGQRTRSFNPPVRCKGRWDYGCKTSGEERKAGRVRGRVDCIFGHRRRRPTAAAISFVPTSMGR